MIKLWVILGSLLASASSFPTMVESEEAVAAIRRGLLTRPPDATNSVVLVPVESPKTCGGNPDEAVETTIIIYDAAGEVVGHLVEMTTRKTEPSFGAPPVIVMPSPPQIQFPIPKGPRSPSGHKMKDKRRVSPRHKVIRQKERKKEG